MKILKKIEKIIQAIENPQIPFLYYLLIFLAVVNLRNFLEIFSDQSMLPFKLFHYSNERFLSASLSIAISFLHYGIFWVALVLLWIIIFWFLTKEKIPLISRVILIFTGILIITPLFDLLISAGKGMDIQYIWPKNLKEFLPIPKGLTPGMQLTSWTSFILSFIYLKIKTKKTLFSLWGVFLLYLTLLIGAVLPFLIKTTCGWMGIALERVEPISIIRLLGIVIFIELIIVFYLNNRVYFISLLKDLRPSRTLHFLLMFVLGIFLFRQDGLKFILKNLDAFCLSLISIMLAWYLAIMLNNLEDKEIDQHTNPSRPTITGAIPQEIYKKIALGIFLASLGGAILVNFPTFFFILLGMGNSFFYSLPPLRLKRIPFFSKFFIAFNCLLLIILGGLFAQGELRQFPPVLMLYFLIFFTAVLNFIDLKDYSGDKIAKIKTLPVIWGEKKAKLIIGIFFLFSYLLIPFVLVEKKLILPALGLGIIQFYLINRKKYQEKWVLLVYLLSLLGLLIWLSYNPSIFYRQATALSF